MPRAQRQPWGLGRQRPAHPRDPARGGEGSLADAEYGEAHLRALLGALQDGLVVYDAEGCVREVSARWSEITGFRREEAIGSGPPFPWWPDEDRDRLAQAFAASLNGSPGRHTLHLRRSNGTRFPVSIDVSVLRDDAGAPSGFLSVIRDLSQEEAERRTAEGQLRAARDYMLAITDSIVDGVFSVDREGRLIYANRAAEALLGWGHDELIGKVVHEAIGFRVTGATGASVTVEDDVFIRKDGLELEVEHTTSAIESAVGRGSVVVFREITARKERERELNDALEALTWIGHVRDGLDQDRFVVFAQPILDLQSGLRTQHELLIRLRDDNGSLVSPARFLPVAEEYSLINDIDAWMLGQAVKLAEGGAVVHVNVSAQSVGDHGVLDSLAAALEASSADPGRIVVELTETALLASEHEALRFIEGLKGLGCRLALDDFGSGYGGFSYLKRFPVDYLKIDREFVADLANSEASRHVVEAVVSLARGLGQKTVAEGVEDEATLELLRELSVDYAQGYHIATPAPADEVIV